MTVVKSKNFLLLNSLIVVFCGFTGASLAFSTIQNSSSRASGGTAKSKNGLQRIAPGEYQCFYLVDGKVLGVGSNRAGELGIGFSNPHPGVPAIEVKFPTNVKIVDVAAGGYQSLSVDSTGAVWTWGSNTYGQKGDGTLDKTGVPIPDENGRPFRVLTDSNGKPFTDVVRVDSGWCFNLALKKDGTVWVWGLNGGEAAGVVGTGEIKATTISRPTQAIFEPKTHIVQVATSGNLILARDAKGGVWSWGGGKGPAENRGTVSANYGIPQRLSGLPPVRSIAAGDQFNYALDANGSLWGWGICGTYLGLGPADGGWVPQPTPKKLSYPEFGSRKVVWVTASSHSTHVILEDGSLWGWGDSAMGEVGNGEILDFSTCHYSWDWGRFEKMVFRPVRIVPDVSNFTAVYSNAMCFYSYAVTRDGKFYSWGRNKTGILGNDVLPTGNASEHPNSWDVALAAQVSPLTLKTARPVPFRP